MKIGIAGYTGRVGQLLVQELQFGHWDDVTLSGGLSRSAPEKDPGFYTTQKPMDLFENSDAVIDFTLPESTMINAEAAANQKKVLVIGTTGLSTEQENQLKTFAKYTPIIYAANMSLGVNLLMALVEQAAKALDSSWDIEIFESHHKHKIDAPSGTALALGQSAAKGRGIELPEDISCDHTGKREQGKIGFSVARGGDVVGEHTAFFYAEGERLELTHRATNRALFARGAIKAAIWGKDKPPGLYSMKDVLGL
jgi:4-hydroxy-tetrahydrodipicolinate reductase